MEKDLGHSIRDNKTTYDNIRNIRYLSKKNQQNTFKEKTSANSGVIINIKISKKTYLESPTRVINFL